MTLNQPVVCRLPEAVPASLEVKQLRDAVADEWDAFVERCPEATFFHRSGWKRVIEHAFGHPTHYLYAEAEGGIEGVLALGQIRSRLFGNALISAPFAVYGGVAASSEVARVALENAAQELAIRLGVDYLEMRNRVPRNPSWSSKQLYVTFRGEISPEPEENLSRIPRKQRAMVRKGIKAGLAAEEDPGVARFFDAYSESVRNLGTPVLPIAYFQLLREVFNDDCRVLTITRAGKTIASVMSFYFRDEVLPYYGGGVREARALKGNDFMYWELMRRSCEQGIRVFDYGRSKRGTGSYDFKKNWGFEPEPLHYEYYLVKSRQVPDVNPLNPRYQLFIKAWQRMPLSLSRLIGPVIAKNLG